MKIRLGIYWYLVIAFGFLVLAVWFGVEYYSLKGDDALLEQGKKVSAPLKAGFNEESLKYLDKQIFITESDLKGISSYADQIEKNKTNSK